jgi:hypothetical protein
MVEGGGWGGGRYPKIMGEQTEVDITLQWKDNLKGNCVFDKVHLWDCSKDYFEVKEMKQTLEN